MDDVFGFVGARKNSKGLPKKNLLELDGNPLFLIALNKLRDIGIKHIIFSSDCTDMLSIAKKNSFNTVKRPVEFSSDKARIPEEIIRIVASMGIPHRYVISVPPTAPLIELETLQKAVSKTLLNEDIDSVVAVKKWEGEFPGLAFYQNEYGNFCNFGTAAGVDTYPRQSRPVCFQNTGVFYIRNVHKILSTEIDCSTNWLGEKIKYVEVGANEGINIDTIDDWKLIKRVK